MSLEQNVAQFKDAFQKGGDINALQKQLVNLKVIFFLSFFFFAFLFFFFWFVSTDALCHRLS